MAAVLVWMVTVGIGLGLLVLTAALHKLAFNAFVCALISINFCIMVLREHDQRITSRGQLLEQMAVNARYLGCNWLWMSLAILAMHLPSGSFNGVTGYALGGLSAATLCLCFSRLISRAVIQYPERIGNFLRLAGFMALAQLVGAGVTVVDLIVHSMGAGARFDWPSLNVIAFSTVALAVISGRALLALATGVAAQQGSSPSNAVIAGTPWRAPATSLRKTPAR